MPGKGRNSALTAYSTGLTDRVRPPSVQNFQRPPLIVTGRWTTGAHIPSVADPQERWRRQIEVGRRKRGMAFEEMTTRVLQGRAVRVDRQPRPQARREMGEPRDVPGRRLSDGAETKHEQVKHFIGVRHGPPRHGQSPLRREEQLARDEIRGAERNDRHSRRPPARREVAVERQPTDRFRGVHVHLERIAPEPGAPPGAWGVGQAGGDREVSQVVSGRDEHGARVRHVGPGRDGRFRRIAGKHERSVLTSRVEVRSLALTSMANTGPLRTAARPGVRGPRQGR
jgi:hypothetical protein